MKPINSLPPFGSPVPLTTTQAEPLSKIFKALADPVRLRLFSLIASHPGGEACVCHLVGAFNLTQPTISHHLRVLRDADLVDSERRGSWVYYRIRLDAFPTLKALFDIPPEYATPATDPLSA